MFFARGCYDPLRRVIFYRCQGLLLSASRDFLLSIDRELR